MTSRPHFSRTSTLAFGACLFLLPYGCFFNDTKGTKGKSDGTGGTTSDTTTNNGTSGASGSSTENAAGAPSTGKTLPDIDCETDIVCKPEGLLCNTNTGKCVQCKVDSDCADEASCVAGLCGGQAGCRSNDDCADSPSGKACDLERGRCVACTTAADCASPESSECINNACTTITPCTNSLGCTDANAPVCDTEASPSRCVQCITPADCKALGVGDVCVDNACTASCTTDSDCGRELKCDTSSSSGFCAACVSHADCSANQYCHRNKCIADICEAEVDQACINGAIVTCTADGDGFASPRTCSVDESCTVSNSRATCGSGSSNSGCSNNPGSIDPCNEIPKFVGSQTVDGKSDDFCSIPSFELSFTNAAGVNNNKVQSGATTDFTQKAVAKVAWSSEAFHAYVEVIVKPVRSNSSVDRIWDGDSIELMVTTNGNATGTTVDDANALHVIANNAIAVTVKSTSESGTHTQINDTNRAWVGYTDNGYAVELNLPWPNSAAPKDGASVRFEMALNVDTESVDPGVWGRDAQAVLALETISGTSTCSATPPTPFCDERLWCSTQLK